MVVSNIFHFHTYFGKISNLTNIFPIVLKPPTRYIIWVGNIIAPCPLRFWSSIFTAPLSVEDTVVAALEPFSFTKLGRWQIQQIFYL